uniref:asparagine--tRNA ligase n=1 Tax=Strombidium rassoulzadegani TaxID=1082188 RepID=A0A7S3CLW5_9SPIT|mmetsp:Transcript_16462/g.27946  ORF Transcript_16462/g.27946 Transcript_16462/m.27946 type:complete len:271 (+) Transcript_16462:1089-1901(+)
MFGKPAFLSVSGQLNVETFAVGLSDCYTFGPTFRAENSHTSRHLCEFWMIEPELAFATLQDDMDCAEDYLKYCLKYVIKNNLDDLEFFDQRIEKGLLERLQKVINTPFKRIAYTECIEILERDIKQKKLKFENKVFWGCDLASEHEKYLTDKVFEGPIIVFNYPKDIKAFYMKMNEDEKTVQAMDVLVPRIGEVIGGSAREDRLDVLDRRINEMNLDIDSYWWYRDLRKYGSVPHCGFGLGFERLVMMATGVENIKDVIPFPRAPGQAEF